MCARRQLSCAIHVFPELLRRCIESSDILTKVYIFTVYAVTKKNRKITNTRVIHPKDYFERKIKKLK